MGDKGDCEGLMNDGVRLCLFVCVILCKYDNDKLGKIMRTRSCIGRK